MRALVLAISILYLAPTGVSAQPPSTPPGGAQADTVKSVPGVSHVLQQHSPAPESGPRETFEFPGPDIVEIHGKQAVIRHHPDGAHMTVQEGDDIEGWKVLSITTRRVTLERMVDATHGVRVQIPAGAMRRVPMEAPK